MLKTHLRSLAISICMVIIVVTLNPVGIISIGQSVRADSQERIPVFGPQGGSATGSQLATAMDIPSDLIIGASLGSSDMAGAHVYTSPLSGFPSQGNSFGAISSGNAANANRPNSEGSLSTELGGLNNSQGNDLVQLTLTLKVPSGATTWEVDWKFLSEEYPEWVGTQYNDAFLMETPASNFTISGVSTINAPNNVAFDANHQIITINTTGPIGMTASQASGTTYDGATPFLTTTVPIPSGATQVTIIFSVMDLGDSIYDSTVFLDNFRFSTSGGGTPGTKTLGEKASELALSVVGGPYQQPGKGWDVPSGPWVDANIIASGTPYHIYWSDKNKTDPGVDCSGLIMWAYNKAFGATKYRPGTSTLSHNPVWGESASQQATFDFTLNINENEILPGDVIFYENNGNVKDGFDHVSMYVGNGRVVNASQELSGTDFEILNISLAEAKAASGFQGFYRLNRKNFDLQARVYSPVTLVLTDPDGLTIDASTLIPSTQELRRQVDTALFYSQWDIDEDGTPDDVVTATTLKPGTYRIHVHPKPDALPTDTYSLEIEAGGETLILAKDVAVSDIPPQGYVIISDGTQIKVNQPPSLIVPSDQTIQYSDPVSFNVAATDPDNASNALTFSVTGLPNDLTLIDNGDGTATISGIANIAPGTYTAEITVTDPDGLSDTKPVDIVVTREDARNTYTGPLMVSTGCESCSTAVVPLRATIQDITAVMSDPAYDPEDGNITNATVSFVDRNNGDAVLCSSNVVLLDPSDQKVGTAFCDWTADLGNSSGNDYVVGVVVDGYYTRNSSDEDTVLVVSKPTSNFITGGGYFVNQNSGGTYYGDPDLKTNFGLNIKFNKKLSNLQGRVTIIVRQGGRVYQIKSNALSSLVSVPYNPAKPRNGTAELIGKANVTDVTDPLNPIAVIGNATLNIVMKDNGEPGTADLISISLWSKDGELLFSSNWDGVQTVQQLLEGGNLSIK